MKIYPDAQVEWDLLTSTLPLFIKALPTLGGNSSLDDCNEITLVRFDIRFAPLRLERVRLGQSLKAREFNAFHQRIRDLLADLDGFVTGCLPVTLVSLTSSAYISVPCMAYSPILTIVVIEDCHLEALLLVNNKRCFLIHQFAQWWLSKH
jgi:hypothetical protein